MTELCKTHGSPSAMRKQANSMNDKFTNITIDLIDNSPFHLKGSFPGPNDTPYEGGMFEVDIVIPEYFPFSPPKMRFITKLYHPNVSPTSGEISLNVLGNDWSPALTLHALMISLQSLLPSPELDDLLDAQVAEHYKTSKQSFEETARYWTRVYARGSYPSLQVDEIAIAGLERVHVDTFEGFGFERSKIIEVLQRLNYRGENVAIISEHEVAEELLK